MCEFVCLCMVRVTSDHRTCDMAPPIPIFGGKEWDYWNYNTAVKMGHEQPSSLLRSSGVASDGPGSTGADAATGNGKWYSFRAEDENTHWRNVTATKVINAECHFHWVHQAVQQLSLIHI